MSLAASWLASPDKREVAYLESIGQKSLVTINTANDNGDNGIEAVCPSTVTNNTASNNGNDNFNLIKLIGAPDCFDKGNTSPDETGCLTGREGVAC